jgi:hypothetical protein
MPVIPVTQEVEIERIAVGGQHQQKVLKSHVSQSQLSGGLHMSSQLHKKYV